MEATQTADEPEVAGHLRLKMEGEIVVNLPSAPIPNVQLTIQKAVLTIVLDEQGQPGMIELKASFSPDNARLLATVRDEMMGLGLKEPYSYTFYMNEDFLSQHKDFLDNAHTPHEWLAAGNGACMDFRYYTCSSLTEF